ncbi:glycosyltransferase [Pectobacterium brasiliense]|uniref:glycosyltransferase n=1 Tax=Pectobacterium brasiliense TaxID=180957 RepID=UPI00227A36A3|nr:glycosyltransferase [Pectobacterium brasiliense]WGL29294.1 glycosyltransferase [Pectobacterium brasiliense]
MGIQRFVLYCNWGVYKEKNGEGFWISSIHKIYLDELRKRYSEVVLISKARNNKSNDFDAYILCSDVQILTLPWFGSYMSGSKYLPDIWNAARGCNVANTFIYVRTFEPGGWIFGVLCKKAVVNYHFIAEPISAILTNARMSKIKKWLRLIVFYPEYLLTCLIASFNKSTCNGPVPKKSLPFFVKNKVKEVIESPINDCINYTNGTIEKRGIKRILFVGYIRPSKGVDVLLDSMFILNSRGYTDWQLFLVGDGEFLSYSKKRTNELGLSDKVFFEGYIPFGEGLFEKYSSSEIFVNPSLSETGPRVLLEAMSFGAYCISTDVGYSRYLIGDNERGKLVPVSNSESIAESIIEYMDNIETPQIKERISKGVKFSRSHTISKFFDNLINDQ